MSHHLHTVPTVPAPRTSPEEHSLFELEQSEQELNLLVASEYILHAENIAHDPKTCLVCFGARMVEAG